MASKRRRRRINIRGLIGVTRKRFVRSRIELEKYERELILQDARELAGTVSRRRLVERFPGRYDERYLDKALIRLRDGGYLTGGSRWRNSWGQSNVIYELPQAEEAQAA